MTVSLPPVEIMREMSKMAVEKVTGDMAKLAEKLARDPATKGMDGEQALNAFARAIRANNARQFPKGTGQ